eukprot:GFYU01002130.1.p1 GENE.GFYU01002130.1~~GFYU01002130.1.p1  ORF type:complete len:458 (+),score=153.42 GFYU01002130.1:127-1500(+)
MQVRSGSMRMTSLFWMVAVTMIAATIVVVDAASEENLLNDYNKALRKCGANFATLKRCPENVTTQKHCWFLDVDVNKGSPALQVSTSCVYVHADAMKTPYCSNARGKLSCDNMPKQLVFALGVLYEIHEAKNSKWTPIFSMFPKAEDLNHVSMWSEDESKELQIDEIDVHATSMRQYGTYLWDKFVSAISPPIGDYVTEESVMWALTIVESRRTIDEKTKQIQLIPFFDYIAFDAKAGSMGRDTDTDPSGALQGFIATADKKMKAGDILKEKPSKAMSNLDMLVWKGLAYEANPEKEVMFPMGSGFYQSQAAWKTVVGRQRKYKYPVFFKLGPNSKDVLDSLTPDKLSALMLLGMDDEEPEDFENVFLDWNNEDVRLQTFRYLRHEFRLGLAKYKTSIKQDQKILAELKKEKDSTKARLKYAVMVRLETKKYMREMWNYLDSEIAELEKQLGIHDEL